VGESGVGNLGPLFFIEILHILKPGFCATVFGKEGQTQGEKGNDSEHGERYLGFSVRIEKKRWPGRIPITVLMRFFKN
jgi:hypothetical protein